MVGVVVAFGLRFTQFFFNPVSFWTSWPFWTKPAARITRQARVIVIGKGPASFKAAVYPTVGQMHKMYENRLLDRHGRRYLPGESFDFRRG
jgi:hypothetical protein